MSKFCLDIETLATPETSGYSLVIPNYAIVKIPEVLTSELEWLYVQLPIQDQIDVGLKTDAKTMNFWFNICAQEFPLALCEMQKSFTLTTPQVILNGEDLEIVNNVPLIVKSFLHDNPYGNIDRDTKVFGNGCHFDCSILQDNHRILFGDGELWHYSAPNNVRTLRMLLSEDEEAQMKEAVEPFLEEFCASIDENELIYDLCLHNPIYDAAKEALFSTYILNLKKSA